MDEVPEFLPRATRRIAAGPPSGSRMYRLLIRSQSLKAGAVFAIGGVCFAVGNLLLARALTTDDFAAFTLTLAVGQLATTLGPLGADTIINRHPANPSTVLIWRILASSIGTGALIALALWQLYGVSPTVSLLAGTLGAAASTNLVAAAFFRSRKRFSVSLSMTQGVNLVILLAAVISLLLVDVSVVLPICILVMAFLLSATTGWFGAFRLDRHEDAIAPASFPWREGRTIIGTSIAMVMLGQLERFALPKLLGNESLATFAVLAAVAGSAFRVLQFGVGYTLVPRLRDAATGRDILKIIRSEAVTAVVLTSSASIAIGLIGRPLAAWMTGGKYELTGLMLIAAIVAGYCKVIASFGSAVVTALGSHGDLGRLRNSAWLAAGAAVVGAVFGARFGLVGALFGVACGWSIHAARAVFLSWPILSRHGGQP